MKLSKKEKEELLKLSESPLLYDDFQKIKHRRKPMNIEQYINFLSFCNKFYKQKANFQKIEGSYFKL